MIIHSRTIRHPGLDERLEIINHYDDTLRINEDGSLSITHMDLKGGQYFFEPSTRGKNIWKVGLFTICKKVGDQTVTSVYQQLAFDHESVDPVKADDYLALKESLGQ